MGTCGAAKDCPTTTLRTRYITCSYGRRMPHRPALSPHISCSTPLTWEGGSPNPKSNKGYFRLAVHAKTLSIRRGTLLSTCPFLGTTLKLMSLLIALLICWPALAVPLGTTSGADINCGSNLAGFYHPALHKLQIWLSNVHLGHCLQRLQIGLCIY